MTRNHRRRTLTASRLIGTGASPTLPSVERGQLIPPPDLSEPPDLPEEDANLVAQKTRGRPRSGVRQAAREAGVPEATYRRHLKQTAVQAHPAVYTAMDSAPVAFSAAAVQRILGHATEAGMLAAVAAEVAAATAPRPPRPPTQMERLRQRVAELEAENAKLRQRVAELEPQPKFRTVKVEIKTTKIDLTAKPVSRDYVERLTRYGGADRED